MNINQEIKNITVKYRQKLKTQIDLRVQEMDVDDKSHYFIYQVLGIDLKEGELIDVYQNKGRMLYKYAGSFLEEITKLCFKYKYPKSGSIKINNSFGKKPKTFEIDCLVENRAIEIKWRDATTDGDHITKEHTRIRAISDLNYIPVRIMFYYPNREQAIKIQETIKTLYKGVGGEYYFGNDAWEYVKNETDINLKNMLENIINELN